MIRGTLGSAKLHRLRLRLKVSCVRPRVLDLLKILVIGYDPCYLSSGKLINCVLCGFGSLV